MYCEMITTIQSFLKYGMFHKRECHPCTGTMLISLCELCAQWCPTLCDPRDVARHAPLSMGFSRQEYWSGLPFPTRGDLPDSRIKPMSLVSPASAGGKLRLAQYCKESLYCASFNICSSEASSHFFNFLFYIGV